MGGLLGFTGERLKHVISRYPLLLKVGEKWDYSRATGNILSEEKKLKKIEEDVETHHVTHAQALIVKWLKNLKNAEEKFEKGEMDQMFLYYHILKITHHFASALGKFIAEANKRPHNDQFRMRVDDSSRKIIPKLIAATQQAENFGGDDMRFHMAEMNDVLKRGAAKFVDIWRTKYKTKQIGSRVVLMLRRRAFRAGVNTEYKDMNILKNLAKELELIDEQLSNNPKDKTLIEILNKFDSILIKSEIDIPQMFKSAHILLRRWLFEVGIILSDGKVMEALGPEWIQINYMPSTLNKDIGSLEKLEKELSGKLHDNTNALNVHLKEMKSIENELRRDLALAA